MFRPLYCDVTADIANSLILLVCGRVPAIFTCVRYGMRQGIPVNIIDYLWGAGALSRRNLAIVNSYGASMIENRKAITRVLTALVILCFVIVGGAHLKAFAESSPDLVPFDVGRAGAAATIKIHVSRTPDTLIAKNPQLVALMILPPKHGPAGDDLAEKYKFLFKNLTGKDYIYSGDDPIAPHKGISVRVIWQDEGGRILRQRDVESDDGTSRIKVVQGASFTLDGMVLPPGQYTVTVEALHDDPRFDGTFQTAICSGHIFN